MITMRFRFFLAFLALMAMRSFGDNTNDMVRRHYSMKPQIGPTVRADIALQMEIEHQRNLKAEIEKLGVPFPPGSSIDYDPSSFLLCMFNTPENQDILQQILIERGEADDQVQVDATLVEFDLKQIEDIARQNSDASPSSDQIRTLWKSGKGHLLATQKLITRSGVNAQLQGVDEQIYPSGFLPRLVSDTNTNVAPSPDQKSTESDEFRTREVGSILNVTPIVGPYNRSIDLVLAPELSDGGIWDEFETTAQDKAGHILKSTVRQPRFHTNRITTNLKLEDGATVVQGGMASRDGKSLVYLFLNARIIDGNGQPVHPKASEKSPVEAAAKK